MPLNNRKIISIILEECEVIEERCDGYKEKIVEATSEILEYERSHRVSATNIQTKINGKFNEIAKFLASQRDHSNRVGDADS